MKNNKLSKITLTILALALLIGAVFAMSTSAENAATETKKPEIISQNIKYSKDFRLMYAVDASTVAEGPVTLYVYSTEPTAETSNVIKEITVNEPKYVAGNLKMNVYEFITPGISYTEMTTNYYVQAVDSQGNKSDIKRYSVAEYLYERLATTGDNPTAAQREFYRSTIDFGKNAQIVVKEMAADDPNLISNLAYVTVKDGTINGYKKGVYPIGSVLTPKADDPTATGAKWTVTPYTNGAAGTALKNQTAVTVTDADKLTVEFGESVVITYRNGYNTLDKFTVGGNMAGGWDNASYGFNRGKEGTSQWENYEGRGVVLRADNLDNSGSNLDILPYYNNAGYAHGSTNAGEYDASTGSAFEISFDMKLNTSGNGDDCIRMNLCTSDNSRKYIVYFYQYEDGVKRTTLKVANYAAPSESKEFDVDPSEWFHVRAVAYKSSYNETVQKWYIYINGDNSNPLVMETPQVAGDFFASFAKIRFNAENDNTNDGCYIDNVFCGYTNETEPVLN